MNHPTISIIVPIYNAASYLQKCLDTLKNQVFADFEAILVNDGSSDDSANICEKFSAIDNRFKLYNKPNGGSSDARNFGIKYASAEYICFADADDELEPTYILDLISDATELTGIDLVIQGFIRILDGVTSKFQLKNKVYDVTTQGLSQFFADFDVSAYSAPYCKVYKRQILNDNNLLFSKAIIYREDYDFMVRYIPYCKRIATSSKTNYKYLLRPGSISRQFHGFAKEYSGLNQIFSSFASLYSHFQSDIILKTKQDVATDYLRRAITAMYVNPVKRSDRLSSYKQINTDFIEIVKTTTHPTTLFTRILKFLLCKKWYCALDALLHFRMTLS